MTGLPQGTKVAFQLNAQDTSFSGEGIISHDDGKFALVETGSDVDITREWSMVNSMNRLIVPVTPPSKRK